MGRRKKLRLASLDGEAPKSADLIKNWPARSRGLSYEPRSTIGGDLLGGQWPPGGRAGSLVTSHPDGPREAGGRGCNRTGAERAEWESEPKRRWIAACYLGWPEDGA